MSRHRLRTVKHLESISALCVGRHEYLSEHLGRFFGELGLRTVCVVGLQEALESARREPPDLVLCDYDLLATLPLEGWEHDELLSRVPVFAVSLTRRPDEMHLLDINGIGGLLYLPTLEPEVALQVLGITRQVPDFSLGWRHDQPSSAAPGQ
jgi:CheY-like chemotaxis protein